MGLRLILDKYDWDQYDYGRVINFKIYDEQNNAFNCSAFANAVWKTFDKDGNQLIPDINITWDNQALGQGHVSYTNANRPTGTGIFYVCVQMWDSAGPPPNQQTSTTRLRIIVTGQPSTN